MLSKEERSKEIIDYLIECFFWRLYETAFGRKILQKVNHPKGSTVVFKLNLKAMTGFQHE